MRSIAANSRQVALLRGSAKFSRSDLCLVADVLRSCRLQTHRVQGRLPPTAEKALLSALPTLLSDIAEQAFRERWRAEASSAEGRRERVAAFEQGKRQIERAIAEVQAIGRVHPLLTKTEWLEAQGASWALLFRLGVEVDEALKLAAAPAKSGDQQDVENSAILRTLASWWLEQGWPLVRTVDGAFLTVASEIRRIRRGDAERIGFSPTRVREVIAEARRAHQLALEARAQTTDVPEVPSKGLLARLLGRH